MVHYPKPYAELVRDAHRMRSEYALSLFNGLWAFLTRRHREPEEWSPPESSVEHRDIPKAA
jgi:hypothetical protein